MQRLHTVSGLRNSGEAYRQFRPRGFISGVHEAVVELLRHRFAGAFIALMGIAGVAGAFVTFWPR